MRLLLRRYTPLNCGSPDRPCRCPSTLVHDRRGPLDGLQPVADPREFLGKGRSFLVGRRPRGLDDAVVGCAAVLPYMLVGFAEVAVDVRRDFREQGDDAAGITPAPKTTRVASMFTSSRVGLIPEVHSFESRTGRFAARSPVARQVRLDRHTAGKRLVATATAPQARQCTPPGRCGSGPSSPGHGRCIGKRACRCRPAVRWSGPS